MRYGPNIVKQMTEELQKVPNVRYVCKKLGIHHSTFYRWMGAHFTFHQSVETALTLGRKTINDAAESVIITGVQNGDYRSATYWLSHNHERYISVDRVQYYQYLDRHDLEFIQKDVPRESIFDAMFKYYFLLEDKYSREQAKKIIDPFVDVVSHEDNELKKVFYAAYDEWKENRISYTEKQLKVQETDPNRSNGKK